ncbi:MAG: DUF3341 domain-containing protein [Candidatus Schekmanbacteria bacterium]|nr:DUF3341 domain-containing protein [Candidatus Schekmanbacteria bacterium]
MKPKAATERPKSFGLVAQFDTPAAIFRACEKVRDAGYLRWDAHTPFPVHGLDKAMGLKPSRLPWISLVLALGGAATGLLLQWWTSAVEYPLIISGKPYFSWPAFVPVIFELSVLGGAAGAVFGMLFLNRLPQLYHALFRVDAFAKVTDDKFFISIEAADPRYDEQKTRKLLESAGASLVTVVEA